MIRESTFIPSAPTDATDALTNGSAVDPLRASTVARIKASGAAPRPFQCIIDSYETISKFPRNYVAFKVTLKPLIDEKVAEELDQAWDPLMGINLSQTEPVRHRYSDFEMMRAHFIQIFPGVFVPPMPPKNYFGITSDEAFLNQRMKDLERFVNRILEVPILRDSIALQKFFQVDVTNFDSCKKEFTAESEKFSLLQTYQRRYTDIIFEYQTKTIDTQMFAKLKKSIEDLRGLLLKIREAGDGIASRFKDFNSSIIALNSHLGGIQPIYESLQLPNAVKLERMDISSILQSWSQLNMDLGSQYEKYLRDTLRYEIEDIEALLEVMERRNYISSLHQKAAKDASKWDSVANPTDKQRQEKDNDLNKEMKLRNAQQAISAVLLMSEIPTLLKGHTSMFKANMHLLSESQVSTFSMVSYILFSVTFAHHFNQITKTWTEFAAMTNA
jgi:hypothetical protein